jgi:hypothetical protein
VTRVVLALANGRQIPFEVRTDLKGPACFALSVRKCGSTLFNQLCRELAHASGRNFVPVDSTFFWNNVVAKEFTDDPSLLELVQPQNVYGEFRDMPLALLASELFRTGPKLLMIRDLRDALVSEYFSIAYSHPVPVQTLEGNKVTQLMLKQRSLALAHDLDTVVLRRAHAMAKTVLRFAPILDLPGLTVLKYEDYVFRKRALVDRIVESFGLTISDATASRLASSVDIRPEKEDPRAFVRHVTPGDHREKLRPRTIEKINLRLGKAMELFGYSL